MAHFFRAAIGFYAASAKSHPVLTLSLTNATLCAASDVVAQAISARTVKHEVKHRPATEVPLITLDDTMLEEQAGRQMPSGGLGATGEPTVADTFTAVTVPVDAKGQIPAWATVAAASDGSAASLAAARNATQHFDPTRLPPATVAQVPSFTLDCRRVVNFAAYGAGIAPVLNLWYTFLNSQFPVPLKGAAPAVAGSVAATGRTVAQSVLTSSSTWSTVQAVGKRVLTDQLMWAPVGIGLFFTFITLIEGGRFREIKEKFSQNYLPALFANYKVWPLVQYVNFCYVPLTYQVPFVSLVSLFWNSYLSWLNSKQARVTPEE
ncbi:hypothetical protein IWQ60_011928, partial [Tieghemiomyces parasiticus]